MVDHEVRYPAATARFHRTRRILVPVLVAVALTTSFAACRNVAVSPARAACSSQPVSDDFTGPAQAPPNPQLWKYQLGAGGADGQLQAYTNSPRNASLDGNGRLAITAINEPVPVPRYGTFNYSSGRINTHGHLDFCYGTLAARIKFPSGQGIKPAFWLLGSDCHAVGWPRCGEIDIVELASSGAMAGSALHGEGYKLPAPAPFELSADWHEYALDWQRDKITTSIDGQVLGSWTPASLPPRTAWVFNDRPMFVILNLAVGGLAGPPDASTRFPAAMLVDWMRYTPPTNAT
jgi:beta-glucanase (GH16 family)